jgi:hypothetical protein
MKPPASQEDVSGKLARLGIQITQTGVSKIDSRTRYEMTFEAAALAKALRVSVSWLYGEVIQAKAKSVELSQPLSQDLRSGSIEGAGSLRTCRGETERRESWQTS